MNRMASNEQNGILFVIKFEHGLDPKKYIVQVHLLVNKIKYMDKNKKSNENKRMFF